ncbi:MAG TPA: ATP-binding protein [Actinospica sp.]|jgi:anti-sigma regulatory factor (Ser/Thr protein kinase)|nr:ATP-binding protein [Actinospica sp.]
MRPNQQPVADAAGDGGAPGKPAVRLATLAVPALDRHIALVRIAAVHVAGSVGLTVGRVADIRLALDEACGQFLGAVPPGSPARRRASIEVRFELARGRLRMTVRGPAPAGWPELGGLGWQVLSSLVGDLHWTQEGGVGTLVLVEHLPAADELTYLAL